MKILVTAGATREPLDEVRYFSNLSTGATGAMLADNLVGFGHAVSVLHGVSAIRPRRATPVGEFTSTADLQVRLQSLLATGHFDAVIHAAAVSDYAPARTKRGKISSQRRALTVRLVPTPKLLPQLKSYAARPPLVLGFKLTAGANAEARAAAVARLFASGTVDGVIHNDLGEYARPESGNRPFRVYLSGRAQPRLVKGVLSLSAWLNRLLVQRERSQKRLDRENPCGSLRT